MPFELMGAYVQAWVWVAVDLAEDENIPTNAALLQQARDEWAEEGKLEIDDNAVISLSYGSI